jgi:tetratricopeptide (TPR) repeat protein
MPTLLDFLNIPPGPEVQGVSLWPLIQRDVHMTPIYSYSETLYPRTHMGWSELRGMRTDTWSFIAAPRAELYNLEHDSGEQHNSISEYPAQAERLRKKIGDVAAEKDPKTLTPTAMDAKTLRALKSLGYAGAGTPRRIQLGTSAPDPKDRVEVLKIFSRVEDLLSKKKYAEAAPLAEQGLRLDPTNPRCHLYLSTAYEQMGKYQLAIGVLQHALEVNVKTDRIYSRLGIDYLHLNRLKEAIDVMVQANRLNPTDLNNLLNLGMAYLQLGRVDDAEAAFKAITAQNQRYSGAHNGLGLVAIARRDADTARREFEKAIEVDPNEVKSLLDLGILYQNTGNSALSLRYLRLFLSKVPRGQFTDQLPAVREAIRELEGDKGRTAEQ